MISRADWVAAVLQCVGTPVLHMGRVPGHGLDCVGVIWAACDMCGHRLARTPDYGPMPSGRVMTAGLSLFADPCDSIEAAHVLQVYAGKEPRHAVIPVAVDGERVEVVHAWGKHAQVRRVPLTNRIAAMWRLRVVE